MNQTDDRYTIAAKIAKQMDGKIVCPNCDQDQELVLVGDYPGNKGDELFCPHCELAVTVGVYIHF